MIFETLAFASSHSQPGRLLLSHGQAGAIRASRVLPAFPTAILRNARGTFQTSSCGRLSSPFNSMARVLRASSLSDVFASLYTLLTAFIFVICAKAQSGPASITMMGSTAQTAQAVYGVQVCSSHGVFWGGSFPNFGNNTAASCWDSGSSNMPGHPFYFSYTVYNQAPVVFPVPAVGIHFAAGLYFCSSYYCQMGVNCSAALFASCS